MCTQHKNMRCQSVQVENKRCQFDESEQPISFRYALVAACYWMSALCVEQTTLNTRTFYTANKAFVLIGQLD